MKKLSLFTVLFLAGLFILAGHQSYAGSKPFRGIITYKISYPNSSFDASVLSQLPKVLTVYISDPMIKTSINMGMGAQSSIINTEDQTTVELLDMMGQKFAIRTSAEENEDELNNFETSIDETGETKEIAGYKCKQVIVNVKDNESGVEFTSNVYYSTELVTPANKFQNPMFKDIEGTMLEYELEMQGMSMKFTATSIKKTKVSNKEFEIPEGYKETTKDELKSNFGGM